MGRFEKTPPKGIPIKEGKTIIPRCSTVAAAGACPGDAVFRCESESTLVWTSNRGHNYKSLVKLYLQHCSRTVQPKYYSVCSTFYGRLFPEPGRVAYNAGLHKGCFYKVGQFQLCKDSLALLTHSKYVFIFEEFASDDSNASFEQCRVVLDVCCFSDHKRRHSNVYAARCNTTV